MLNVNFNFDVSWKMYREWDQIVGVLRGLSSKWDESLTSDFLPDMHYLYNCGYMPKWTVRVGW